jgi:hypothetical protein
MSIAKSFKHCIQLMAASASSSSGKGCIDFVAAWRPTAHTLACLRFAARVTALVSRLATD